MIPAIGRELRRVREYYGLSLSELARRAGVSKGHLSHIENGEAQPGFDVVQKLVSGMGLTMSEFLMVESEQECVEEHELLSAWRALPPEAQDVMLAAMKGLVRDVTTSNNHG